MKLNILILILIFIAGCGEEKVQPTVSTSLQVSKIPAQESWGDTVFFSDSGNTKAILYSKHLRMYDSPQETLLDTITVKFFNPEGQQTTTLTANRGKVNDITKDLYAIDSVVAVNDSGVTLKTQELVWQNKDRKITSDKFVTITSPKERVQGYGFESDQNLKNYTIYNITYVTRMDTTSNSKFLKKSEKIKNSKD